MASKVIVVIKYTFLFHLKILTPSKFPTGIILNSPSHELIMKPYVNINPGRLLSKIIPGRNTSASIRFINGPAREIIPFCILFMYPFIWTAPGAANTNPRKLIPRAKRSIRLSALNSASQLYFCATSLCASSWNKNPRPTVKSAIPKYTRTLRSVTLFTNGLERIIVNARLIASHALRSSRISFLCISIFFLIFVSCYVNLFLRFIFFLVFNRFSFLV